jgi:chemotaxis protein CheY-P-specific phosphatase CheC
MVRPPTAGRAAARRIRRLAYVGAGRAASALASFLGRDLLAREPRLCAASGAATAGRGETGVIFEVEGAVQGLMALLLPGAGCRWMIEALCPGTDPGSDLARSAVREAGNIVASHAVSAMADHLGGRVTLSVPTLVDEHADRVFGRMLDERRALRDGVATQTELCELLGERRALLLFAPDAPTSAGSDTVRP